MLCIFRYQILYFYVYVLTDFNLFYNTCNTTVISYFYVILYPDHFSM